jgi:hypothetical protein
MCKLFVADAVGDGAGIGRCRVYSKRKKELMDVPEINFGNIRIQQIERELRALLIELGNDPDNKLFWGGDGKRNCGRHESKSIHI